MTQAKVKDCMERVEGEAKERFKVVEEFEEEMTKLSDKMSKHSLVCTVSRLGRTVDRMEEEEKMVERRLDEVQEKGENILGFLKKKHTQPHCCWRSTRSARLKFITVFVNLLQIFVNLLPDICFLKFVY